MSKVYPEITPRPLSIKRLQFGNLAYFHIREDEMDKVIGIHDFANKLIFLFEGSHRHARQKFRQYSAIVSEASLERFDDVYTLHNAEAWLSRSAETAGVYQYVNVGSLTVKSPVLTTSVAYPDLAHTLIGPANAGQRAELDIVITRTRVRS